MCLTINTTAAYISNPMNAYVHCKSQYQVHTACRQDVMSMLNSTIFDCLIFKVCSCVQLKAQRYLNYVCGRRYQGYGDRVAQRSHVPGEQLVGPGFQLDLGLKDITLALDVAHKVQAPMPFASVLRDRFLAATAKGRGTMDWSAIGAGLPLSL